MIGIAANNLYKNEKWWNLLPVFHDNTSAMAAVTVFVQTVFFY